MNNERINRKDVDELYKKLKKDAESAGYHLNPDEVFSKDLIHGLLVNEQRYGYWACPCRLSSGTKAEDLDIICPCDYRDRDLDEYGLCYCALYVSNEIAKGLIEISPIPERRSQEKKSKDLKEKPMAKSNTLSKPVWRCKVCGYLCGRDQPPSVCPICKAKKERFERFI
jgi:ferredoxin-thioredoxin reductase catalytic subunit